MRQAPLLGAAFGKASPMSREMTSLLNYHASRAFLALVVRDAVAEPMATATATAHATASPSEFTMEDMRIVEIVERTMSTISILGSIFVLISFLTCPSLNQKSVNRLIFYASWGNMMSNVATLISVSGLRAGVKSGLCQAQGFLIQWYTEASFMTRLRADEFHAGSWQQIAFGLFAFPSTSS